MVVSWVWAPKEELLPTWLKVELPGAVMTLNRESLTAVNVILCEHKPPRWLAGWKLTNLVVTSVNGEFLKSKWSRTMKMTHHELGGLTTGSVYLRAHSSIDRRWVDPIAARVLPTTVYSVASDTVDMGRKVGCPDSEVLIGPPQVLLLGSNTFHGGGLHPLDYLSGKKPYFLLRSVLVNGWVRRRLTTVEEWTVKDVPVRIAKLVQDAGEDVDDMWRRLKPGRCLEHGLRQLFSGIGVIDMDNRVSKRLLAFGQEESEPMVQSRLKQEIGEVATCLNEMSLQKDSKKSKPCQVSSEDTTTVSRGSLEGPEDWDSDEEVDVKATKSDDAKVEVGKWNKEVIRTLSSASHWASPQPDLAVGRRRTEEQALDAFRNWMLKWYKRRSTRRYSEWKFGKSRWKFGETSVQWNERPKADVTLDRDDQINGYVWTDNGRSCYDKWWRSRYEDDREEAEAAWDSLGRLANTTWWEWKDGSRCLHWKWPCFYQSTIRDGIEGWFKYTPGAWTKPQLAGKSAESHGLMKAKLQLVGDKRYITKGYIKSLTSFFGVEKGLHDIRMVYDGTKSGLNDALWVPSFWLPTIDTMLRAVTYDTVMNDFDIGDCFLNFVLHETLQAPCGVDLTRYFGDGELLWERWVWAAMGLKSSPYQAVQAIMVAKEIALGDRKDPTNAFRWDEVKMNLPGSSTYDPGLP